MQERRTAGGLANAGNSGNLVAAKPVVFALMISKVHPYRWAFPVLVLLVLLLPESLASPEKDPLLRQGLPVPPGEPFPSLLEQTLLRVEREDLRDSASAADEEPENGVVVEAEVSDERDLAKAKVRDAKADAEVETARDRTMKPRDVETTVRLQIYLDEKQFGPGFIDGKPGKFTTKAVHSYNRSVGRLPDDWGALISEATHREGETYAIAIVPDSATAWVNPALPFEYSEQAKEERPGRGHPPPRASPLTLPSGCGNVALRLGAADLFVGSLQLNKSGAAPTRLVRMSNQTKAFERPLHLLGRR